MLPIANRSSLENIVEMMPEVVGKLKHAVKKEDKDRSTEQADEKA